MLEFLKRNKAGNTATIARKLEEKKDGLRARIADIESRIANGTHVHDDAKILESLNAELRDQG